MERVYGEKYEATKGLDVAEIAKLVRADIASAVKAGTIPKAKYSVTIHRYAGGRSLNVRIAAPDSALNMRNIVRAQGPIASHHRSDDPRSFHYSPAFEAARAAISAMVGAYNYDGSDSQTDYYDVRFASDVAIRPVSEPYSEARNLWIALKAAFGNERAIALVYDAPEGDYETAVIRAKEAVARGLVPGVEVRS